MNLRHPLQKDSYNCVVFVLKVGFMFGVAGFKESDLQYYEIVLREKILNMLAYA